MFEYQDSCVALRCIPNLMPGSAVDAVAVEWSTDYALLGSSGRHELVSVKHRDPGQHDWTFGRLKKENVFRDLHAVWHGMGENGDYVFESNAGFEAALRPYIGDPGERPEPGQADVRKLADLLQADPGEVRRFLCCFFLRRDPLPRRSHIQAVAARDLAVVMGRLGLNPAMSETCLAALTARIAAASTQRPPGPGERVARLTGFIRDLENRAKVTLAGSLLTMEELRGIVVAAAGTGLVGRQVPGASVAGMTPFTEHDPGVSHAGEGPDARGRRELLLEAADTSRGRLAARWAAAGLSAAQAQALAADDTVGCPSRLGRKLPVTGLMVLEGDFGSGKSVTAERIHQAGIAAAACDDTAPLPVYLSAKQVPGPLLSAVRGAAGELGDLRRQGLHLVLDGLDEPGHARAGELLDEARALVFSFPASRVIATARPGLALGKDERLLYPPLNDDEARALARRLGGPRWAVWNESAAVRDVLRLPLFLIVAVVRHLAGATVPRSRGTFLDALASAALERTREPSERCRTALLSLATLTVSLGGTVPAAELGDEQAVRMVLETRLVIPDGRGLRFALPVVEQYFAARAALESGLGELDLNDLRVLDRWRDSLTLAVTIGSWHQVSALLDSLSQLHPGSVSWLVASAVPYAAAPPATQLPGDIECARRLHHAASTLVKALGPVSQCLGFTDARGNVPTVGARTAGTSVAAGLRAGHAGTDAIQLPEVDRRTLKEADGSAWRRLQLGHPAADFPAWPWHWGLKWVSQDLEKLLRARTLPLAETAPFRDERRWELSKAICGARGTSHRPLDGKALLTAAGEFLTLLRERKTVRFTWAGSPEVVTYPDEIAVLVRELSEGTPLAADGQLHRPYPVPDVIPPAWNTVGSPYSDEALRLLVEQVHANALVIYQDLVATWFPTLAPLLGLACIMPVLFTGRVMPGADSMLGPGFAYEMKPLPLTVPSRAEIRLAATEQELHGYDPSDMQSIMEHSLRLNRLASAFRPGAGGWAHPRSGEADLAVWGDRPATVLACRWLWEDLKELHLVEHEPPFGEN
jgi:hypothetical protein